MYIRYYILLEIYGIKERPIIQSEDRAREVSILRFLDVRRFIELNNDWISDDYKLADRVINSQRID